jgi:hypothetical protein
MAICSHNPSKARGKCPPYKVAEEFSHFKGASKHRGWREAHAARHGIKY